LNGSETSSDARPISVKVLFFANTDWYLWNFRLDLARFLREQGLEVVLMSPPGRHGPRCADEGFRWLPLPMDRRSLNPFRELALLGRICAAYRREQPDAVFHFTLKCVIYGGLAAQAAGVRRRIHAVTGLGHVFISSALRARLLRPLAQILLRLALRGADSRLIVQNPDDRHVFLHQKTIAPERIQLIRGSGVDTDFFRPEQRRRKEKCAVLLAARLLREKGVQEYAEAAALLAHRADDLEFLLAGEADPGNPSSFSETELQQLRTAGRVRMLGHVDNMRQLLGGIDLMALPSRGEGLPRSLLEAAAMGLPLVAADAPGCREIVEDGVNGFLVPVGDAAALAEKIELLLDQPALRRQFGAASREKAVREFDRAIVFRQTWELCRSLGLR
jgi:glycosyltransferase involved in cell wall biosynthesis